MHRVLLDQHLKPIRIIHCIDVLRFLLWINTFARVPNLPQITFQAYGCDPQSYTPQYRSEPTEDAGKAITFVCLSALFVVGCVRLRMYAVCMCMCKCKALTKAHAYTVPKASEENHFDLMAAFNAL